MSETEIIDGIIDLLDQYGVSTSAAYLMAKAIPWQFKDGAEKYILLYELMSLALDLKCPTAKCVVGNEDIDSTVRSVFLEGIMQRLKKDLSKGETKNYEYLYKYIEKAYRGWDPDSIRVLFFIEDLVDAHLNQINQTYNSIPEDDFSRLVEEKHQYVKDHIDELDSYPGWDSIRVDSAKRDLRLLANCIDLLDTPCIPKSEYKKYQDCLRKIWAFVLGQGVVSEILNQYYNELLPETPLDPSSFKIDTSIETARQNLPYPMESPEYQYVESLFKAYHEPFDDFWAHPELGSILNRKGVRYEDMPLWDAFNESRDLNYLVAQFFHYCLTMSFFPKAGDKTMIKIGSIIYDLLCLLEYRKDKNELYMRRDSVSQKEKYDLVKRYLAMDPTTGRYKRAK